MNYALDTPIKRTVFKPQEEKVIPIAPHTSNQTQDHHVFQWLHHKPQTHAIFPLPPQSGRDKK
uniref:Uncharacterized protein n=1 Tax=viral metagenome TaxID=1070528 RepID=A0A6C0B190_9ZZZZ